MTHGISLRSSRGGRLALLARAAPMALAIASQVAFGGPAAAGPVGGVVVGGEARIETPSSSQTVVTQASARAAIDWTSFSVGADEQVVFRQPDASSVALNRVLGADPSAILGQLSANGQVWLVNPNGVFFGQGARVDVAGLIATTHGIAADDFMAGRLTFQDTGSRATVENRGEITIRGAGLAAFVAPGVVNDGVISARLGSVVLGSARMFTVDYYGDQMINLSLGGEVAQRPLGPDGAPVSALVANNGAIFADGGRVLLSAAAAKGVVDTVISTGGVIQARSVESHGGEIVLSGGSEGAVQVAGSLDAGGLEAGARGGIIQVTGRDIGLEAGSRLDVSGDRGGGLVQVGGGFQGAALAGAANADTTRFDAGAEILADALSAGQGGRVVLWGEDGTGAYGRISARGGALSGDGGLIETSAKGDLRIEGLRADASAAQGKAGLWLLDPGNFTIDQAAANTIAANLNTADVTITTVGLPGTGDPVYGGGDIIVRPGVQLRPNNAADRTLTFQAYRNILINGFDPPASFQASGASTSIEAIGAGKLNLILNANAAGVGQGVVEVGVVFAPASTVISTHGGALIIGGGACTLDGCTGYASGWNGVAPGRGLPFYPDRKFNVGVDLQSAYIDTGGGAVNIRGLDASGGTGIGVRLWSPLTTHGGDIFIEGATATDTGGMGLYVEANVDAGAGDITLYGNTENSTNSSDIFFNYSSFTSSGDVSLVFAKAGGDIQRGTFNGGPSGSIAFLADDPDKSLALVNADGLSDVAVFENNGAPTMLNFGTIMLGRPDTTRLLTLDSIFFVRTQELVAHGAGVTITANGRLDNQLGSRLVIDAGLGNFTNLGSGLPIRAPVMQIWSQDPALDSLNGLRFEFVQYGATYGVTTPAQLTGGGHFYAKAAPVVTAHIANASKTYDGGTAIDLKTANFSFTGAYDGDVITLDDVTADFATKGAGTGKAISANGVAIAQVRNALNQKVYGYELASSTVSGTGAVAKRELRLEIPETTVKVYDGAATAFVAPDQYAVTSGLIDGDEVFVTGGEALYTSKNAGLRNVTVTNLALGGADGGNYNSPFPVYGRGEILQKTVTVTLVGTTTKTYDGAIFIPMAADNYEVDGLIDGDLPFLPTVARLDSVDAGTGKTVFVSQISVLGSNRVNYSINTLASAQMGVVTPKELTVTISGNIAKTYDGGTVATLAPGAVTLTGKVGADQVSLAPGAVAAYADRNAGENKTVIVGGLSLTGAKAGNYTLASTASAPVGRITPKALDVSLTGHVDKTYDGSTAATLNVSNYALGAGVISGDQVALLGPSSGTYSSKNAGTGKTVTVTGLSLGLADAGNYSIVSSASADIGTINPKALTAALTGTVSKTYDGDDEALLAAGNYTLSPALSGDHVSLAAVSVGIYNSRNVGAGKTVTVAGLALQGSDAGNYTVNAAASGAIGVIDPKALTASLVGTVTKTYDGGVGASLSGANYALDGVVAGDRVGLLASASGTYNSRQAGTGKVVSVTGLGLSGEELANYTVNRSASGAVGVIEPKLLTASLVGVTQKTYDGDTDAELTAANYYLPGIVTGDDVSMTKPEQGAYESADPGSAKTVSASDLALLGADAANYRIAEIASGDIGYIYKPGEAMRVVRQLVQLPQAPTTAIPDLPPPGTTFAVGITSVQAPPKVRLARGVIEIEAEATLAVPTAPVASGPLSITAEGTVAAANSPTLPPEPEPAPLPSPPLPPPPVVKAPAPAPKPAAPAPVAAQPAPLKGMTAKPGASTPAKVSVAPPPPSPPPPPPPPPPAPARTFAVAGLKGSSTSQVMASLSPSAVAGLTAAQTQALTPELFARYAVDFGPAQVAAMTDQQLQSLSPAAVAAVGAMMSPAQVAALSPAQKQALSPTAIAGNVDILGLERLQALTPAEIATLSPAAAAKVAALLTPQQVAGLTPEALAANAGALSPEQVAGLSATQVAGLPDEALKALADDLLPEQMAGLSNRQLALLPPAVLARNAAGLSADQVQGLTPAQVASLPATAIGPVAGKLSLEQALALTPGQIAGLAPAQFGALPPELFAKLPSAQVAALTPAQLGAVAPAFVAGMAPAVPAALSPAQLAGLTPDQLRAFDAGQVRALTPTQMAALNLAQVGALNPAAMTPAQLAMLSPAQIAAMPIGVWNTLDVAQLRALPLQLVKDFIEPAKIDLVSLTPAAMTGMGAKVATLPARLVGLLAPDQLGALTPAQVGVLDVKALTSDQIAAFSIDQIKALKGAQIAALPDETFSDMTPAQFAALDPSFVASMSDQKIADFAQGGILKPALVARLGESQVAGLSVPILGQLPEASVQAFTAAQLGAMDAAQVAAIGARLSPAQVAGLSLDKLKALDPGQLSPAAGRALAEALLAQPLSAADLRAVLTPEVIGQMSAAQLASLETAKGGTLYAQLTPAQKSAINDRREALAADRFARMSDEAFARLSAAEFAQVPAAVLTARIASLTPQQIAMADPAWLAANLGKLTPAQFGGLSREALLTLPLGAVTPEQVGGLDAGKLALVMRERSGAFTPDQLAGAAPKALAALPMNDATRAMLLPSMTPDALAAMPPAQLRAALSQMSSAAVGKLSPEQLDVMGKYLSFAQVQGLDDSQVRGVEPKLAAALNAARHPQGLTDVDAPVAGLSPSKGFTEDSDWLDDTIGAIDTVADPLGEVSDALGGDDEGGDDGDDQAKDSAKSKPASSKSAKTSAKPAKTKAAPSKSGSSSSSTADKAGSALSGAATVYEGVKTAKGLYNLAKVAPVATEVRDALYQLKQLQYETARKNGDTSAVPPDPLTPLSGILLTNQLQADAEGTINAMLQEIAGIKARMNQEANKRALDAWLAFGD